MRQTIQFRPGYTDEFRCAGSKCEDTCCQEWSVPVDQAAFERFEQLPGGALKEAVTACMMPAETPTPFKFATIRMTNTNHCPLLTADRLCRLQAEGGAKFLCYACRIYPRIDSAVDGELEQALTLSCPEAARLVLLSPTLQGTDTGCGPTFLWDDTAECSTLLPYFWPVREAVVQLVLNRAYPLWQRLFLLGVFCRRLDAIQQGEVARKAPEFLTSFAATVAAGALRPAMESLPLDRAAQLDAVLRLAGLLLHRSIVRPRFVDCIHDFTTGIGNGPEATLDSISAQFNQAHDRHFAPFFAAHPHMLENYLLNTIFRCQFPFGRKGLQPGALLNFTREFALLTAQFALVKGLLIGVAGCHGECFAAAHVIRTVQAVSKHFEHHPEFLNLAWELLVESKLDGARGLAILLRNAEPSTADRDSTPAVQLPRLFGASDL